MKALPFGYWPLGWKSDLTAQGYIDHMSSEYDRLSICPYTDLRRFEEVRRSLEIEIPATERPWIHEYTDRSITEANASGDGSPSPDDFGFEIHFSLNRLGNLSMRWEPDEMTFKRFGIRGDYNLTIGGRRPLNELVFIKDVGYLCFPDDRNTLQSNSSQLTSDECLSSDMICCVRRQVEETLEAVKHACKVKVFSAFEFALEDRTLTRSEIEVGN